MTVRDIQSHLLDIYDIGVSPDLISKITDAILEEVREWRARPLAGRAGRRRRSPGTGGPRDATVLCTAEDVHEDLTGEHLEILHAGRVARVVGAAATGHEHAGEPARTAWDVLVRLVRTG